MGIRQKINEHSGVASAVIGCVICLVVALSIWLTFGGHRRNAGAGNMSFYSDDDGKTWFVDQVSKVPPFDHNGKQAVRATVFRCRANKPFVAYLQRFSAAEKAKVEAAVAKAPESLQMVEYQTPMEAKKPGDAQWVSAPGAEYQKAITPVCPDGSLNLVPVTPADSDNGATP